ncbi:hypothetical protein BH09PSE4_BH09PSE4_08700 [soil metagenome]
MKLTRDMIVLAALDVLDERGLDAVSLRAVAARLSVQAPALYWHVRSKAELLSHMAASFYSEAARAELTASGWGNRLATYARILRQVLLTHPDAARLCALAAPLADPHETALRLAAPLVEAGLDSHRAVACQACAIAYTVGWVLYEQSQAMHDHLARMIDFSASFEMGLAAMIRGFTDL